MSIRHVTKADAASWLKRRHALWPHASEAEYDSDIQQFLSGSAREPQAVLVAGVLLGSGKLATELDRLDLIDEYKFLVHPRIAGHGPTLYQSGLHGDRVKKRGA